MRGKVDDEVPSTGGVKKLTILRRWAVGSKSVAEVQLEGREAAQREATSGRGSWAWSFSI